MGEEAENKPPPVWSGFAGISAELSVLLPDGTSISSSIIGLNQFLRHLQSRPTLPVCNPKVTSLKLALNIPEINLMSVQGDERWEINIYLLGALFIGSALLFPAGIIGLFRSDVRQLRQRLSPTRARALLHSVIGGTAKL